MMTLGFLLIACHKSELPIASKLQQDFPIKESNVHETKKIAPVNTKPINMKKVLSDQQHIDNFRARREMDLRKEMGDEAFEKSFIGKVFSKDPKIMTSISDRDSAYQKILKAELELQNRLGYIELDQAEMDYEYNIKDHIFSTRDASLNANFELSKIPAELESNYLGYAIIDSHPDNIDLTVKSNVMKRVFNYHNSTISLEEESTLNSNSHFVQEFVNTQVCGYPAMVNTIKSNGKSLERLVWNDKKYKYTLICRSSNSIEVQRADLHNLAEYLTKNNRG